jgi:hypothetical protein
VSDGAAEPSSPSAPEDGVHRLLDMLVEEVSLVDRAANKRRFLIVKRDAEMATKKKTVEPVAVVKAGAPAPPAAAGGKTPPFKKKPAKKPAAPPAAGAEKARKPPAKDPPEEEEEEEEKENGETSKATPPKTDPDKDPDEEEDDEQEEEPGGAPAAEDKPTGKKPRAKADENAAPEPGAPDDEAPDDEETPLSVALAALDSLTQAVEILSSSPEDGSQLTAVAEGIKDAYDAITSAAGIEPDTDEGEEPGDEASIAGLVASIQEMLTKIDSLTQALSASSNTPAATPTITAETQAPPDLAGTLTQVAQAMKSLDTTVKAQGTRLEALEKRTGLPNSRPAGERVAKGAGEEDSTSWPIDMNRPRDRASVDKAVSFHDD